MRSFSEIRAIAAPLDMVNIDTDMIIPKQFLKTVMRDGLGKNLFEELRYDNDGAEIPDFVLNCEPYRQAQILVTGQNFGCGSSREHAPWALIGFGISAIIAPSYADIFYNNCFKNGILPIILPEQQVKEILTNIAENPNISISLPQQSITHGDKIYHFEIDGFRKKCLLEGLDDIGLSLQYEDKIDEFETAYLKAQSWI